MMTEKRREMEARVRAEREQQRGTWTWPGRKAEEAKRQVHLVKIELTIAVDSTQTPAQMVDYLLSGAYEQTQCGLLLDWEHLETSEGRGLAEVRAEAAEEEANQASKEAAEASDFADGVAAEQPDSATAGKQAHWQAAQAHDRAAHANSMASIAHQAHADAGGEDPAGEAHAYANTPAEAAEACSGQVGRHMAEAIYHRKQADVGMAAVGFLVSI